MLKNYQGKRFSDERIFETFSKICPIEEVYLQGYNKSKKLSLITVKHFSDWRGGISSSRLIQCQKSIRHESNQTYKCFELANNSD